MKNRNNTLRAVYGAVFCFILLLEVLIALFLEDDFIRPYGGDILVTVLICCFARIFVPTGVQLLPVWVFLLAAAVEVGQYFDFVAVLGLGESRFFRILLGSTFSWADLICYGIGCGLFFVTEGILKRGKKRA